MNRWLVPVVPVLVVAGVAALWVASCQRASNAPNSARSLPGELDEEGAALARNLPGWPILWLGEEFRGFRLTRLELSPGGRRPASAPALGQTLFLAYGDCEARGPEPSCAVPVQIQIRTPGQVPAPDSPSWAEGMPPPYEVRGVRARDVERGTTLWLPNGFVVTVFAHVVATPGEAVAAVSVANADRLGIADIGPGESLAPLAAAPAAPGFR